MLFFNSKCIMSCAVTPYVNRPETNFKKYRTKIIQFSISDTRFVDLAIIGWLVKDLEQSDHFRPRFLKIGSDRSKIQNFHFSFFSISPKNHPIFNFRHALKDITIIGRLVKDLEQTDHFRPRYGHFDFFEHFVSYLFLKILKSFPKFFPEVKRHVLGVKLVPDAIILGFRT